MNALDANGDPMNAHDDDVQTIRHACDCPVCQAQYATTSIDLRHPSVVSKTTGGALSGANVATGEPTLTPVTIDGDSLILGCLVVPNGVWTELLPGISVQVRAGCNVPLHFKVAVRYE